MSKMIKYFLLSLAWLLAGILVLLIVAALLIQTKPVKQKLAKIASSAADPYLNGKLTLGEIEGNFFSNLRLSHILLVQEKDTLAYIESLNVRYKLWPLLSGKLEIEEISVQKPFIALNQINDSTWNVQQVLKPQPTDPLPKPESTNPFSINLAKFQIVEGKLKIDALDTIIPRAVNQINVTASGNWSSNEQKLALDHFSLITSQPNFDLKELSFKLSHKSNTIELADFHLKTAANRLFGMAKYDEDQKGESAAKLESDSLHLDEFEYFLPDIHLPAMPVFKFKAANQQDAVTASLELEDENQRISIRLESPNLMKWLFENNPVPLIYEINTDIDNIDIAYWTGIDDLKIKLNGELKASGKGIDPKTATIDLSGDFSNCIIQEEPVEKLNFKLHLNQDNLDGFAEARGNFGAFKLKPNIQNITGNPVFQVLVETNKLDLAQLTGIDSLYSNLNLTAHLSGSGTDMKNLRGKASVTFSSSKLQLVQIDTLISQLSFADQNLKIDSLWLQTRSLQVVASGNYSLNSISDLQIEARLNGLDEFRPFIPLENLQTSGRINASIKGKPDSLQLQTTLNLYETSYEETRLEKLRLTANALITKVDTLFQAKIAATNLQNGSLLVDSINVVLKGKPDSLEIESIINGKDLTSELNSTIRPGAKTKIKLDKWRVDFKNQHWALQNAPAHIEIDSIRYSIENFKMASGETDSAQYISANGQLSLSGDENFTIEASRIDLNKLQEMFQQNMNASGYMDLAVKLGGSAGSPEIAGNFKLDKAILNDYRFTDFHGSVNYSNQLLALDAKIVPQDSGKIEMNGKIPLQLKPDSMSYKLNPKDSVQFNLIVDRFPLAVLQTLGLTQKAKGYLQGSVSVNGTVESPDPKGRLELKEASLEVPEYGISYKNILFDVAFLRDKIQLDTFLIRSDDGTMTADGQIDFNSDFYKGNISQSKINVKFDKFNPVDHRQFNMQVSGSAGLQGNNNELVFDGDLIVPQSEFYLPAILNMMGKMEVAEIPKPILVEELEKISQKTDPSETPPPAIINDSTSFDYLNMLTGKIRVKIPKNTWIKNEDLRLELSGDLELIKHRESFEAFGTIDVVRGQYDLMGRTFIINSGNISFRGGEEMIPRMDIQASYTFRSPDRAEQKLALNISGIATSPEIKFTLDDNPINEGDALSYILFGTGMNELTLEQQTNLRPSGSGSLAETAAASILSSQISKFLGNKLNVDYIEVKSNGGFENATVVVGKYITNDLFMSYEQNFGETNETGTAKYEVRLEYELFRFLFFQLNNSTTNSGFDLIFKIDSK